MNRNLRIEKREWGIHVWWSIESFDPLDYPCNPQYEQECLHCRRIDHEYRLEIIEGREVEYENEGFWLIFDQPEEEPL